MGAQLPRGSPRGNSLVGQVEWCIPKLGRPYGWVTTQSTVVGGRVRFNVFNLMHQNGPLPVAPLTLDFRDTFFEGEGAGVLAYIRQSP